MKRRLFSQGVRLLSRNAVRPVSVVGVLCGALSCVATSFQAGKPFSRPAKPSGAVEMLKAAPAVRPFEEVGTVHARSGLGYRLGLDKLIDEAASRGCDALLGLTVFADYQRSSIGDTGEKTREDDFTATCVIYLDFDAGPPPRPVLTPDQPAKPFHAGSPD